MYINTVSENKNQMGPEYTRQAFEGRRALSIKSKYPVFKANPLLMVREDMNITQARFFVAYLCKVNPSDPKTYKVRFSLSEFRKMLNVDTTNIQRLKDACLALLNTKFDFIEYRRRHGEKIDSLLTDAVNLFERFAITKDSYDRYYVYVTPTRPMEHLLTNMERYGYVKYEAKNALALSTKRHIRIYELFKRHEEKNFSIETNLLKTYLGLVPNDYPSTSDFKRDVLDKGLEEVNKNTDIFVSYLPIKKGRGGKIVGFKFRVKKKAFPTADPSVLFDDKAVSFLLEEDIGEINSNIAFEQNDLEFTTPAPKKDRPHSDIEIIEKIVPKNVYNNNPENLEAILSILEEYLPSNCSSPLDRQQWIEAMLVRYHDQSWAFKAKKTKHNPESHYRSCLYYWLKDRYQTISNSIEETDFDLPEVLMSKSMSI